MTDQFDDPWATAVDEDDPFATADDVKSGGKFEPSPFLDALPGRLVAMVPRAFDPEAKKRADRIEPGQKDTEERYTVDMVVLDGGELRFWTSQKKKLDNGSFSDTERETVEVVVPEDEIPKLYTGVWRTEGNIVGALKKIDGKARPVLLGRVRRGPQAPDKRKGVTTEQVEAAYEAWEKRGKNGPKPKFSWFVDVSVVTDADRAIARQWLTKARAEGFTL